MLRAGDFGGMQAAIDVHDGFAFARQSVRRRVVEAAAASQALRDLLVAVQCRQVRWRGDDRDFPVEPARGFADGDQLDAIAGSGQAAKVIARFLIVRKVEIVAGLMSQHGFRGGHRLRGAER